MRRLIFMIVLAGVFTVSVQAQEERYTRISLMLDSLSLQVPGLNDNTELMLTNVPLHDYLRTLGKVHRINLYIENTPTQIVTASLVNEPVKNVLLFICRKFNLTIEPVGTILNFTASTPEKKPEPVAPPREIKVDYKNGIVSFDLTQDSLSTVLRKLSRLSGERIITKPGTEGLVTGYIPPSPLEEGLESLLFMNGFTFRKHPKGFFIIGKNENTVTAAGKSMGAQPMSNTLDYSLEVMEDSSGKLIFLTAESTPLNGLLRDLLSEMKKEYYIYAELTGNATTRLDGATVTEVLNSLMKGTDFTWKEENGVILIGKRDMETLRQVKVINLKYRPTEKVIELMPAKLKENVELKEFVELNKIILSGSPERIREIEAFILEIDKPVPMVKIEMMVVDVNFEKLLKAGVKAGLGQAGDSLSGVKSILPGIDYSLNGSAINQILKSSGIPTLMALGTLKSNFYLNLQAQETRGNVKVLTQPVISTLNGNSATLTIGEKRYFLLQTNTFNNSAVNSFNQVSQQFQTIDINTTVTVKPFVAQDGMLTLEVKPTFTSPGAQPSPNIPPDIKTRSFESTIRIRDGETVALGGLSQESTTTTTAGLPLLSRIPVIRWLSGTNSRGKSKSSLMIYITPTILYN